MKNMNDKPSDARHCAMYNQCRLNPRFKNTIGGCNCDGPDDCFFPSLKLKEQKGGFFSDLREFYRQLWEE